MKFRKLLSTLLAAALMCGLACTAALAAEGDAGSAPDTTATAAEGEGGQQPDIEDWRAEQKIVVNGETYNYLGRAIFSETEDKPVTVRLDSNVLLTGTVVLGVNNVGGSEMTVASHDVTIDLNGYTLKGDTGVALFEVQDGYTLTIVDNSEAKTGKLGAGDDPMAVCEFAPGATIIAFGKTIVSPEPPTDPAGPEPGAPAVTVEDIPAEGTAYASTQNITIDGTAVEFQAYALKDENNNMTNYVKLRDIAFALNGSAAQFEVGYDGTISLTTKTAYTAGGTEMTTPYSGDRAYKGGAQTVKVDGADVAMTAITLTDDDGGGYNYFKLRDLGAVLGFTVGYSNETGISITTAAE